MKEQPRPSFLYIAISPTGYLKVGVSTNVRNRIRCIPYGRGARPTAISANRRLYLLHSGPGTLEQEAALHKRLDSYRAPGTVEWYIDCPEARFIATTFIDSPPEVAGETAQLRAVTLTEDIAPADLIRTCLRCGHDWLRRSLKRDPKQCPKCHSPYWDRQRRR
jgi:hypothetical protein